MCFIFTRQFQFGYTNDLEPAHYSSLPINIKMKVLLTAVFFLLSWAAKATDISFVVYHSKGAVSKSSSKQVLKKGDKIFFQEVLVIGDKASLVLICSNYKVIQISKKGIEDIAKECGLDAEKIVTLKALLLNLKVSSYINGHYEMYVKDNTLSCKRT